MENRKEPVVVSFVSGKGGVGKTSIAVNYAWVSAQSRPTLLVDLDIQNQGLTGLLARFSNKASWGSFEMLSIPELQCDVNSSLIELCSNLMFLPATSHVTVPSAVDMAALVAAPGVEKQIASLLRSIRLLGRFEMVILDCHGGLDYLSLGSHRSSDVTVMITEADTVTFNGTLELANFYRSVPQRSNDQETVTPRLHALQVVVNRVPPKFKYPDLSDVYQSMLPKLEGSTWLSPKVLSFFPQEDFLSDSFGEYPFCAELAPNSVFSKKLWVMDYDLTGGHVEKGPKKLSRRVLSNRFRLRVSHCLVSNEAVNIQRMLSACGALACGFVLYLLFMVAVIFSDSWLGKTESLLQSVYLYGLLGGILIITWFLVRALWGTIRYYSDKYAFKRRLWTSFGRRLRVGERVILARLLLLRVLLFFPLILSSVSAVGIVSAESIFQGSRILKAAAPAKVESEQNHLLRHLADPNSLQPSH